MSRVLLVLSSPRGAASYSSQVARALAERLAGGDARLIGVRDLNRDPVPHIDELFVIGRDTPSDRRTAAQQAVIERSDRLIREVTAADIIVIASAMINFGISSTLKAWIDHLTRAGVTFRYTEKGPEGLIKGKKVYVVKASGGVYEGPMAALNFQAPYLERVLAFIGLTDVEFITIDGVALGAQTAQQAVAAALERIAQIVPLRQASSTAA